jgi:hypothetical protein
MPVGALLRLANVLSDVVATVSPELNNLIAALMLPSSSLAHAAAWANNAAAPRL